jgi:HAD superfamily hydrolase (TIGR01509 family)
VAAGVIFDLDGVIIDSEELQYEAYLRVLEPFGVRVSRAVYEQEWIAKGRGPEYAVRTWGLPLAPDELRTRRAPVYRALLRSRVRLMDGAGTAVARLARHFPLALATNSTGEDADFVLARFDLRRHFRAVVAREAYEGAKPEPDAFLAAAAALALAPQRCVVIEDAYKGVLAAARAGCPCIAIPHDFTRNNDFTLATRVLAHLDEVTPELIAELVASAP